MPISTKAELMKESIWRNKAVIGRVRSSGDEKIDAAVWSETLCERDQGWVAGPLDLPDRLQD
eukprot:5826501-Amphidinium_carterae.1